jgi:hypothetical protein
MIELVRLAKLVLNDTYPVRQFLQSDLAKCLRRVCPDDSRYEAVRDAALIWFRQGPTEVYRLDANDEWEPVLPQEDLALLVEATRTEIVRSTNGVLRGSPPNLDGGRLFVRGELVARWKHQGTRPAQLKVLERFQESGWPEWIENCLGDEPRARMACSKINKKMKGLLHFAASFDRITWSYKDDPGGTSTGEGSGGGNTADRG